LLVVKGACAKAQSGPSTSGKPPMRLAGVETLPND
jgi:hypothetical protein